MENQKYAALVTVGPNWKYKVFGLTTIERTLLALSKAGVNDVAVVTDETEAVKRQVSKRTGEMRLHFYPKSEAEAARQKLISLQPDQVYVFQEPVAVDISVLEDLKKSPSGNGNTGTMGGEVQLLQLVDYQSTGKRAPIEPMIFGHRNCHPVRSEEEKKAVKRRMISNLTKPTDGWVSRYLNRPISTRISWVLANFPVTPNHVTIVNGLFGFLACYFMYEGGYWNWFIAGAIIHFASVVDGVDGELARLKFQHSKFGQSLDTFFDYTTALAALVCLVLGVRKAGWPEIYFQTGVASGIFAAMAIASLTIYVLRRGTDGAFNNIGYSFKGKDTTFAKVIGYLGVFTKRELYNLIFFLFGVFGVMPWALFYVAIMAFMVMVFAVQANFNLPKK